MNLINDITAYINGAVREEQAALEKDIEAGAYNPCANCLEAVNKQPRDGPRAGLSFPCWACDVFKMHENWAVNQTLYREFEEATGKKPVVRGKETKAFLQWLNTNY